ncbi:endonuclease/exonuclease/phosphatase family protein [Salinibacter sp. 10B]|uniref:endonuclease/exonuclease/phosphatase family protein n=1 Tax=Salinibacter sp. 10B TaxID=1923971 RepID=UPI000CF4C720|nr:endonuclease/exonuclease/phosphatase family protein [Salinibacter sp. 10B]
MDDTFRRLLLLILLVGLLGGVEYFTGIDVPGFDFDETGIRVPESVELPEVDIPNLPLPQEGGALDTEPQGSSVEGEIDGPHVRVVSWNLYNFGRTKDDQEISVAAETLRDFDLVAVQEVVTSPPGAQAIGKLDDALDRTGFAWDYRLSDPTTGPGTERYAFLWKPSRVRLVGQAWLESSLADAIDREPYLARFEHRKTGQRILVASLHAVPSSKNPAREVALLDRIHRRYEADHVILLGDFNLDEDDAAFDELRRLGYRAVLDDQPTSLGRTRDPGPNGHLASEYDNVFFETGPLRAVRGGVLDFTPQFSSLKEARSLSDHLPVYMDVQWTASAPATP